MLLMIIARMMVETDRAKRVVERVVEAANRVSVLRIGVAEYFFPPAPKVDRELEALDARPIAKLLECAAGSGFKMHTLAPEGDGHVLRQRHSFEPALSLGSAA